MITTSKIRFDLKPFQSELERFWLRLLHLTGGCLQQLQSFDGCASSRHKQDLGCLSGILHTGTGTAQQSLRAPTPRVLLLLSRLTDCEWPLWLQEHSELVPSASPIRAS